jgi:serine/threonine protein kinase
MCLYLQISRDGVPKIGDVGSATSIRLLTGTFRGTVTHIAPEVFTGEGCSVSMDIYSLGVVLWELWYGPHAHEHLPLDDYSCLSLISDMVRHGLRPPFKENSRPFKELEVLMCDCWHADSLLRPVSVADVRERLRYIQRSVFNEYWPGQLERV